MTRCASRTVAARPCTCAAAPGAMVQHLLRAVIESAVAAHVATRGRATPAPATWPLDLDELSVEIAAPVDPEPAGGAEDHGSAAAGWERLRELEEASTRIEIERAAILADLVRDQAERDLADQDAAGAEPDRLPLGRRRSHAQVSADARVCVVDTAVTTLGGSRHMWVSRVEFGLAPPELAEPVAEAVAERVLTFGQACALIQDTADPALEPATRARVCDAVLGYARARSATVGAPVGQEQFRGKVRRELARHLDTAERRERALRERRLWLSSGENGTATLGIVGADARCLAARRRVDAIARAARADGDPRTLAQLHSDVALDLLLFGEPAPESPTSVDHPGDGGWPAAVVNVVVSAASLLGVNDEPGLVEDTPVAAAVVRRLARQAGSTWRRIVTDPVTGYAMAQVVKSYRPPAAMAAAVIARDGTCRAPGCGRPAVRADLDHVVERRDGGDPRGDHLQALCRMHHSKKTRRHWGAHLGPDGAVRWRLPDGREYTTYPCDYRELGLETVAESAATATEPEARAPAPNEPGASPDDRDTVPIARADLIELERETAAANREIDSLRAQLASERAAHAATADANHRLREAHPPF